MRYAEALLDSIKKFTTQGTLHVLVSDIDSSSTLATFASNEGFYPYLFEDVNQTEIATQVAAKYRSNAHDAFRWSMKPVFINYLIQEKGCDKVIYVDCDISFFNDPSFLFEKLTTQDILLTPHWRSSDPYQDFSNFQILFNRGIYNAGFIGVNKSGTTAMDWWARACTHTCIKDPSNGLFDDQTYLNLLPVYFDNVEVLKHRGCNVANWNQVECERVVQADGSVLINGKYPIIFIHFTASTIRGIFNGSDEELLPYLLEFEKRLRSLGINSIEKMKAAHKKKAAIGTPEWILPFSKFFSRLRLRSRVNKIL
ncbi:MAG: hypothetical protein RIG62_32595 [Cyclobacteriaceae bacterium]